MRFETLGRRIATAPRAIVLGLVALTLALTPGAVRVRVAPASLDAPEFASFALTCEGGVWSLECLANLDELTRALANAPATVVRVDSLATRHQVVAEGGALHLRPLVAELPATRVELRRLHARALADPAATRGLIAGDWTTLVRAELRGDAAPGEVHALVESLRAGFERPPEVSLAVVSRAWSERELELGARRDLTRLVPDVLVALRWSRRSCSRACAGCSSRRWPQRWPGRGVSGLLGFDLGTSSAALSSAIAATAAAVPRAGPPRPPRRRGARPTPLPGRSLLGAPLAVAGLARRSPSLRRAAGVRLARWDRGWRWTSRRAARVDRPACGWLALSSASPSRCGAARSTRQWRRRSAGSTALRGHATGVAPSSDSRSSARRPRRKQLQSDGATALLGGGRVRGRANRARLRRRRRLRIELDSGSARTSSRASSNRRSRSSARWRASLGWLGQLARRRRADPRHARAPRRRPRARGRPPDPRTGRGHARAPRARGAGAPGRRD